MSIQFAAAILTAMAWTGLGTAGEPERPAQVSGTYAFLFGESIPKKLQPGEEPGFGIQASHIDWWVGSADGKKLRRLDDPKTGRLRVRPVNQTVILKKTAGSLTLLGPDGRDLIVSLTEGPLAKTELDPSFITTFSFTPDGKSVVFVNKTGAICRFTIGSNDLVVKDNAGVDPSRGIQFSLDGVKMLYTKYFRANDFVPPVFSVYVADTDGSGEKKLTEYQDGNQLGSGFLPDGRVGVVGATMIRAFDSKTGKVQTVAGPWQTRLKFRAFGGFNPDGSTFIFDVGGPYELRLFAFDVKSSKITTVRDRYLESFQRMVWVQLPPEKR